MRTQSFVDLNENETYTLFLILTRIRVNNDPHDICRISLHTFFNEIGNAHAIDITFHLTNHESIIYRIYENGDFDNVT